MLSVRNAILAALVLLLIVFIGGAVNLTGEPDSGGAAADSYGTHRDGYRATVELLAEFGVPVERRIAGEQYPRHLGTSRRPGGE